MELAPVAAAVIAALTLGLGVLKARRDQTVIDVTVGWLFRGGPIGSASPSSP